MASDRFNRMAMLKRAAIAPALALAFVASGANLAQAQTPGSVQDFRLPPASPTPSPTPTAAGPVDTDHPTAAPSRPASTPSPSPIAPPPTIAPPAPVATQSAPRPSASATPRPQRTPQAAPSAEASQAPLTGTAAPPAPISAPSEVAPEAAASAVPSPAPAPAQTEFRWPSVAGGVALLVVILGFVLRRRRKPPEAEAAEDLPVVAQQASPEPSPPATLPTPRSQPAEPPLVAPTPSAPPPAPAASPAEPRPIEIALEARHLSRAMVNATLAYRLTVTNTADKPLGPLKVAGDIITAHASLSAQDQLAPADAALTAIHQVPALAAGEAVTLSGELRLPLASILPMRSGSARVFVPLARFRVESGNTVATRVFVVGQASEQPGGALRPFPLDRGPGVDRALGQRELEVPA